MRRDPDIIYRRGSQWRGVVYPLADTVETLWAAPIGYTGRPFYSVDRLGVPEIRRFVPHKVIYEQPILQAGREGEEIDRRVDDPSSILHDLPAKFVRSQNDSDTSSSDK